VRFSPPRGTHILSTDSLTDKEFFPPELWSTLEGDEGDAVRKTLANGAAKRKALMLTSNLTPAEREERRKAVLEKLKTVGEDDEVEAAEDVVEEEEEEDFDYEDDEDEMGGDYDAEQYFDGGEDDEDDMGDGGGDDY
jgi:DNA-directed RNA polymerase III subunit RPC7